MGCLFAIFGGLFPRAALILLWIFTDYVDRAFSSFLVPLLGLLFLPFTTLMYTWMYAWGNGVDGIDWLWIGIAFLLDIASYGNSANERRRRAAPAV
jgi:UDP-N-acetylmuramyl pentapeptide phosphotransferase/UDP-N-acetylglucosamine-1-phosphate transferase